VYPRKTTRKPKIPGGSRNAKGMGAEKREKEPGGIEEWFGYSPRQPEARRVKEKIAGGGGTAKDGEGGKGDKRWKENKRRN